MRQGAHKKNKVNTFYTRVLKVNINFECKKNIQKNYQTQRHYNFNGQMLSMSHIIINRINDFHVNGPFQHSKFNSKIICFILVMSPTMGKIASVLGLAWAIERIWVEFSHNL